MAHNSKARLSEWDNGHPSLCVPAVRHVVFFWDAWEHTQCAPVNWAQVLQGTREPFLSSGALNIRDIFNISEVPYGIVQEWPTWGMYATSGTGRLCVACSRSGERSTSQVGASMGADRQQFTCSSLVFFWLTLPMHVVKRLPLPCPKVVLNKVQVPSLPYSE